jgi:Rha family phage regulatory protein
MKSLKAVSKITSMSSVEVAELTSKRHDHVLRDIDVLLKTLSPDLGSGYKSTTYKDSTGRKNRMYEMDKDATICLVAGYDANARMRIIKRWQELELEVAKLKAEKEAALKQRETLKVEYKPMTDAIQQSLESQQKKPKFYHFSNEADLINRVILGCTSGKFRAQNEIEENESIRDYLSPLQLKCFTELQRANTVYITDELEFEERKEKLMAAYNKRWRERLIEEHIALDA